MIEGMTILTQTEIYKKPDWVSNVVIILAIIALISFIIAACNDLSSKCGLCFGAISIICFISMIVLMFVNTANKMPTGRYKYQVTFDENVSIQEVYDKYKVLDVDGKLWTIEDKE